MDIAIQHPWFRRALGPFHPSRLFDQFFGDGLFECDLLPFLSSTVSPYYRQSLFRTVLDSGISELMTHMWFVMHQPQAGNPKSNPTKVRSDRDKFAIFLDVKHFSPEDLTVKVQEDFVEIHGKHSERQHGSVTLLGAGAVLETVRGPGTMLTFSGPKVASGGDAGHSDRAIPVSREEKPGAAPSS
ncbi:PREDICTED: alpha-crystallin A chain [Myotis davidii]|uniref:alpha-crystallin A chain n=1 Tax=Myotis davidii TaxID=225400 RepID=UPI0007673201|nr:PREDICTED: alpha-crystallin A chain [Myotis davidii]